MAAKHFVFLPQQGQQQGQQPASRQQQQQRTQPLPAAAGSSSEGAPSATHGPGRRSGGRGSQQQQQRKQAAGRGLSRLQHDGECRPFFAGQSSAGTQQLRSLFLIARLTTTGVACALSNGHPLRSVLPCLATEHRSCPPALPTCLILLQIHSTGTWVLQPWKCWQQMRLAGERLRRRACWFRTPTHPLDCMQGGFTPPSAGPPQSKHFSVCQAAHFWTLEIAQNRLVWPGFTDGLHRHCLC